MLEQIFIEKRIYRDIEECETWEAVIKAIQKGLKPFIKDLKKEVTSPNGTTEAALNMMKNNNFEEPIISGIKAAYHRAKELNND